MRMSALFGAKNFGLFKIYCMFAQTRGKRRLSQCGHFADKGGRVWMFRDFVLTFFMDGLLLIFLKWSVPKNDWKSTA